SISCTHGNTHVTSAYRMTAASTTRMSTRTHHGPGRMPQSAAYMSASLHEVGDVGRRSGIRGTPGFERGIRDDPFSGGPHGVTRRECERAFGALDRFRRLGHGIVHSATLRPHVLHIAEHVGVVPVFGSNVEAVTDSQLVDVGEGATVGEPVGCEG